MARVRTPAPLSTKSIAPTLAVSGTCTPFISSAGAAVAASNNPIPVSHFFTFFSIKVDRLARDYAVKLPFESTP